MGIGKKASALLDGLRRHRNHERSSRGSKDSEVKLDAGRRKQKPGVPASDPRGSRLQSGRAGTVAPGKQTEIMAQTAASSLQNPENPSHRAHQYSAMGGAQQIQLAEHVEEDHQDGDSYDGYEEEEDEDDIDESVAEDMKKLEESFRGISQKYRLINRIGEGTFSTVYKAEQLNQEDDEGDDTDQLVDNNDQNMPATKRKSSSSSTTKQQPGKATRKPQFVALKKIYVTSSPHRIANELELLHALRHSPHICPLLTAFRHLDQVVAVLPYFRHLDFRLYYRDFLVDDMRHYFKSLFLALNSVHRAGILHRDIKPTNFLYDHTQRRGVLVDFGLAEKQGTDWQPCLCLEHRDKRKERFLNSFAVGVLQFQEGTQSIGYPKNDSRSSRRANRAGTRGFRAPEVLLKCTSQTTKIDIWSAGVILLTLLARRFPFFNSADDVDAMIEMASIFGKRRMKAVAAMHGSIFETNIETIGEKGFGFERIIVWASCREPEQGPLHPGERQAIDFLEGLLELDPGRRWSAREALDHEFFTEPAEDEFEKAEREQQEEVEDQSRIHRQELHGYLL